MPVYNSLMQSQNIKVRIGNIVNGRGKMQNCSVAALLTLNGRDASNYAPAAGKTTRRIKKMLDLILQAFCFLRFCTRGSCARVP